MKITFLGKDPESRDDECLGLYDTDRGTYLVRGWRTTKPFIVEVPRRLLLHVANSGQLDAPSDGQAVRVVPTGYDTYLIFGREVTDAEALVSLRPLAETEEVIEVGLGLREAAQAEYTGAAGT
ncbi:hypothetical protein [Streptosporangium saharense]|uniref:hypothetical protein n=1 Tax=Streptosporangium saharense TaxID=1706840 RepID=UPI003441F3CF